MTTKRARTKTKSSQTPPHEAALSRLDSRATRHRSAVTAAAVIFLIHCLGLLLIYTPLQGLFDELPIIEQDWGLHFHHLRSLEGFWRQDKSSWGYNPLFMAGYPSNTIQDLSIKLFEFLALALSL